MAPRGYLIMERFQVYEGFLGMIRFDNLWVWVGLAALILLRFPLHILLSHSLMADRTAKHVMGGYTLLSSVLILAALVIARIMYPINSDSFDTGRNNHA